MTVEQALTYDLSQQPKSDLYRDVLPLLNSKRVDLLDHPKLIAQLCGLERRTARSGRDSIDHAPGAHDDVANAAAGALLAAHVAHKQRIRVVTQALLRPDGTLVPSIEIDPSTGRKIESERTRIRFVRLSEQEAPAVRGQVHSKLGH